MSELQQNTNVKADVNKFKNKKRYIVEIFSIPVGWVFVFFKFPIGDASIESNDTFTPSYILQFNGNSNQEKYDIYAHCRTMCTKYLHYCGNPCEMEMPKHKRHMHTLISVHSIIIK